MSIQLTLKFNFQLRREPSAVTVELRSGTAPYNLVESVNGTGGGNVAATLRFEKATDGAPYYIVVKSANSLETWSATPVTFSAGAASYDFTTSKDKAYGSNQTLSADGIPSIYQGDINQDGCIDLQDVTAVHNQAANFATQSSSDLTGDNVTDLSDVIATYNNATQFVAVMRP